MRLSNSSKDLILICVICVLVFVLSYFFDVFIFLVKFFQKHPHSITYIDEIITALVTLSIGFAVFSWRRSLELRKETAERIRLQGELLESTKTQVETERVITKQLHAEIEQRKAAEEKLKTMASHDELTGCLNFRSFMDLLENEIARSKRYQQKFSIIMMDIDDFKKINDEYGHLVGNNALAAFSKVIKSSIRNIDTAGRYGGDEFMIVLPESDPQHALVVLERIRNSLGQVKMTPSNAENTNVITLQFSAGIAAFPFNAKDLKELIWVVDSAMRQAKQEGKNRAVLERRRMLRLNPMPGTSLEIIGSPGEENGKTLEIANISKEGVLLLSTQDIPDKDLLCRIRSPRGKSSFQLACKVKHKDKSDSEVYRIGVYFPDAPENVKEGLSSCIEPPKELG